MSVRYVKATVSLGTGLPRIIDLRGPYEVPYEPSSLLDALEAVFEYDNFMQEDGPALTGYGRSDLLDFVLVEWSSRRYHAYCAPRGWIVFGEDEESKKLNEELKDDLELPLFTSREEIVRIHKLVKEALEKTLS